MRKHAMLLGAVLLAFMSALSYAQAPVPFINLPLIPDATAPGGAQFTLTVNGTGFVSNSLVNWNGTPLATQFVNGSRLKAIVPAADVATASTGWVKVVNPPPGGGTSNMAFFAVTASTQYVGFALGASPPTPYGSNSVAVGDFNGDGKLDLAVTSLGNFISILLGDGAGNFTLASTPTVGDEAMSVAVGDFNGDGKLDLAVANFRSNNVSILLGDGAGNFTLASSPPTGSGPYSLAVGDFNGDGKLDLAVANFWSNNVSILLGDGAGNFTLASSPPVGYGPMSVAVGDFNGDGKLDLVTADEKSNTVSILLGDGTGHFTLTSTPTVGDSPQSLAVGDFNRDGKLDLAVANESGSTVSILLGDGTGNFALAFSPVGCSGAYSMTMGDFNADGKLDLALACFNVPEIAILLGDGTGNFALSWSVPVGQFNWALATGDFNGDGKLDLAIASENNTTLSILLQVPPAPAVSLSPSSLTFGAQVLGTRSKPQVVTLTNTGSGPLIITKIASSSANFRQTNDCGSQVPPQATCTINVTFSPTVRGTQIGTVTFTDNASNSPQTVPLTGVGTAVKLSPSRLDFGSQPVGTTSQPQIVTVTNHDKSPVNIYNIHFIGRDPGDFAQTNNCGRSVPAGGSCSVNITFTPQANGARAANLAVNDDGSGNNSVQTMALSGTGT